MNDHAPVPCNGCTACCKNQLVMLMPEDDATTYNVAPVRNPLDGKMGMAIVQKPNGDCFYLGETGCTIYDRAPLVCRTFDCRLAFLRLGSRAERRRALHITRDSVLIAGNERLGSLTAEQRATRT